MFEVMQTCGNNSIFEMMSVYYIRLPWIIVCMESILPDIQIICLNFCKSAASFDVMSLSAQYWIDLPTQVSQKKAGIIC